MAYIPPLNGGRVNATIAGNTAGAGSLVSSGTLTLAGGNNITLSQAGNAITISGPSAGAQGTDAFGISNLGNTSGVSGMASGTNLQVALAGGNNITLSQSLNGSSGTITVSAANQTVQTQNLHNLTLAGNTAGAMAQVSSGTLNLAGGNNITLSQNANSVTISGASQSVQTQNLHNISLSGNTAGVMTQVSSGTLTLAGGNNITLSQAGNAITIAGAGAGGAGLAVSGGGTSYSNGTVNLSAAGGALTIASSTGSALNFSVPQVSTLFATGAVSISTNAGSINIGAPQQGTISNWEPQPLHFALLNSSNNYFTTGSVFFYKLQPQAYISASHLMQLANINAPTSSNSSFGGTISMYAGIYTANGATLSLITNSSGSNSFSWSVTSNSTASVNGMRGLTIPMVFNASPGNYWIGIQSRSATVGSAFSASNILLSVNALTYAGVLGVGSFATQGILEGAGVFATTSMPASVAMSAITQSSGRNMPYMAFKNQTW